MKNILQSSILIFGLMLSLQGKAQNVYIPDANFKSYLVGNSAVNSNGDAEIQISEASSFNGQLICDDSGITDLTGIEAFTSLTVLDCHLNLISSLDVSANAALTQLFCDGNQLTSLNVSANTALTYLDCRDNQLTTLDISFNPDITQLFCSNNQLTSLNLANGNNYYITNFLGYSNPNLSCIQVDDVSYSQTYWNGVNFIIDAGVNFSLDCDCSLSAQTTLSSNTLTATLTGANYQWFNCSTNTLIPNETAQSFTPTSSGNYSVILTDGVCVDTSSCVFICALSSQTTLSNGTLSASFSGANYQWINCTSNTLIPNATAQSFTPSVTGNYAVIVSDGLCVDTSSCQSVTVNSASIFESDALSFSVFPNPASETIVITNLTIGSALKIVDMTGKTLIETLVTYSEMTFNLDDIHNGIYFIELLNNNEIVGSKKLVINK